MYEMNRSNNNCVNLFLTQKHAHVFEMLNIVFDVTMYTHHKLLPSTKITNDQNGLLDVWHHVSKSCKHEQFQFDMIDN